MDYLIENWYLVVSVFAVGICAGYYINIFMKKPTSEKIATIKSWLIYACVIAEKQLGSGTGALKLRAVYDDFIVKFPAVAAIVSFDTFSGWVSEALEEAKHLMETNPNIKEFVE